MLIRKSELTCQLIIRHEGTSLLVEKLHLFLEILIDLPNHQPWYNFPFPCPWAIPSSTPHYTGIQSLNPCYASQDFMPPSPSCPIWPQIGSLGMSSRRRSERLHLVEWECKPDIGFGLHIGLQGSRRLGKGQCELVSVRNLDLPVSLIDL